MAKWIRFWFSPRVQKIHRDLTENYTFAEMDFVVRRTFLRSTNEEDGSIDPDIEAREVLDARVAGRLKKLLANLLSFWSPSSALLPTFCGEGASTIDYRRKGILVLSLYWRT